MTNTKKGFTLIELLIVITIIGILAAALLPQVLGAPARARDAARIAEMNQLVTGLETYAVDNNGAYPAPAANNCVDATALADYFQGGDAPTGDLATETCTTGFFYCLVDSPNNYMLATVLETVGGQGANATDGDLAALTACDGTEAAVTTFTTTDPDMAVLTK